MAYVTTTLDSGDTIRAAMLLIDSVHDSLLLAKQLWELLQLQQPWPSASAALNRLQGTRVSSPAETALLRRENVIQRSTPAVLLITFAAAITWLSSAAVAQHDMAAVLDSLLTDPERPPPPAQDNVHHQRPAALLPTLPAAPAGPVVIGVPAVFSTVVPAVQPTWVEARCAIAAYRTLLSLVSHLILHSSPAALAFAWTCIHELAVHSKP